MIFTETNFPSLITGVNSANLPFSIFKTGFNSKFKIVDPYPVPDSYKYRSVMPPFTTGVEVIVLFWVAVPTPAIVKSIETKIFG